MYICNMGYCQLILLQNHLYKIWRYHGSNTKKWQWLSFGVRCHIFSISSKIYMPRSSSRHRNGIKFYSMSSNVTLKSVSFSIYVHVVCPVSKQTCSPILDLIETNFSSILNHQNLYQHFNCTRKLLKQIYIELRYDMIWNYQETIHMIRTWKNSTFS